MPRTRLIYFSMCKVPDAEELSTFNMGKLYSVTFCELAVTILKDVDNEDFVVHNEGKM